MNKRELAGLKRNFGFTAVICLALFFLLSLSLSKRVQGAISEISENYMATTNSQLQQKFKLVVELTQEKIDGVINRNPPEEAVYGEAMLEDLRTSARVRSFVYLGFMLPDGRLETVYGNDMSITDGEKAIEALDKRNRIAESGKDGSGERCILLGRSAAYPTESGEESVALVAGISTEYMSSILFADADDSVLYSHIIDGKGDCVIRTHLPGTTSGNYIEYIRTGMEGISEEDAERYIGNLKNAIEQREEYADTVIVGGEPRRVYCMPLQENSTWYLISVMPYGFLDETITNLDRDRMILMGAATVILLVMTSLIFLRYYHLSQVQMRALDAAREEASRSSRFKSVFLSNMSHDIRTPMNAITGMSEIAMKNLDDRGRVEDCLRKIKLSSKQLLGLVNDILDISKIESGKMTLHIEELSLRETMNDIVNIIQPQVKARNQNFDIFIQDITAENVWCDSVRLNQVLLNLLSNALKFTPEGGRIEVYLWQEPSPKGEEYIHTHIKVDDTGIGMSPEFQAKIFESFERESSDQVHHTSGSGLGMSIVKHIVDLLEGTIELHSEQGKGSSFHVTFDLKKAKAEAEMALPPWNILVIDDNQSLCESAAANLEKLGVQAEWALSCSEALRMVKDRLARNEEYQFILVDWFMPDFDGLQTIQQLRLHVGDSFPIYLISAYDWSDIQDQLGSVKIQGFISKPLFASTLYDCLSQYMDGPSSVSEPELTGVVDLTGKRVLLAEDNELNWEIAETLLGESNLELDHAENGKVCVEKFEQSEPGYYDAVLMDIRMPVMDGYEAAKMIRASGRPDHGIPIIAMTADSFSEDVQHCLDCGMNGHLSKPLDFRECVNVLRRFLKKT